MIMLGTVMRITEQRRLDVREPELTLPPGLPPNMK